MNDYNYYKALYLGLDAASLDRMFATPLLDKAMQSKYAPVITPLGATPLRPPPRVRYALRCTDDRARNLVVVCDNGSFGYATAPEKATLFVKPEDALAALVRRTSVVIGWGNHSFTKHGFSIVKVIVTEAPGTRIVREQKASERVTGYAIRTNGAWYWAGSSKEGNYAHTANAARMFPNEQEAVRFATTGKLTGDVSSVEFVPLTTNITPSTPTYEVVEL